MKGKKKIAIILAIIAVLTGSVAGGYWLYAHGYFTRIKLRIVTSPFPVLDPYKGQVGNLCEALELLLLLDQTPLTKNYLEQHAAVTDDALVGCVHRKTIVFEAPSQAEYAFQQIVSVYQQRVQKYPDTWSTIPLEDESNGMFFSSDFHWEFSPPPRRRELPPGLPEPFPPVLRGESKSIYLFVRQCNVLALISIFVTKDDVDFSPGIEASQQELAIYGNLVSHRMKKAFCTQEP